MEPRCCNTGALPFRPLGLISEADALCDALRCLRLADQPRRGAHSGHCCDDEKPCCLHAGSSFLFSCRYGAREPLACLWRERGFIASKGEDLENRERPPGSVSAAAAGPSAGTSRRSRRPLCSAARFRPRCAGPSFQGLVQRVRDTYEVYGLRSGATANPSLPAEAPGNAQVRGLGEALSTPRGLPALQCHQLCPRRFYRVKGWWKAAGAPIS